jgi:hypothetical protein
MAVNPSFIILAILGSMIVAGGAISTIIVPVLASSLQEKVTICHIPKGNPSNAHDITVGASAVPAHLAHGDTVGPCVTGPSPPTVTAMVTVIKVVNGGPNLPEQFNICVETDDESTGVITPATPPCAPGSASGFTYIVKPGAIAISEPVLPTGYEIAPATCLPSGMVTGGQTATCTMTNTFTGP